MKCNARGAEECMHYGACDEAGQCVRPALSEGTASAQRINAAPIPVRCDFGGICNRDHGAQCAAVCRRQRGEA